MSSAKVASTSNANWEIRMFSSRLNWMRTLPSERMVDERAYVESRSRTATETAGSINLK